MIPQSHPVTSPRAPHALVLTRSTVNFIGNVQGVGFRMTACNVAKRFAVGGFVRNERDGSVRCVVEGEKPEVDRFINALQRAMEGFIEESRIEESAATGEFQGRDFDVRR